MKNKNTGIDERCAECKHYKPGDNPLIGMCTLHWRLNQKWDTKTEYDLWCQYWEGKQQLREQHEARERLAKALQDMNEKESPIVKDWKEKTVGKDAADREQEEYLMKKEINDQVEGPEPGVQMGYQSPGQAAGSLGAGMQYPGESNPVPALDNDDVVYAIIRELNTQIKELSQMDSEAAKNLVEAAKAGDRMAATEIAAMLRVIGMIRTNVINRMQELKAQIF